MWAGFGIVSALYRRERAADDELEAETVSLLRELVRTPSVNPPGDYDAVVELLVDAYESFGWDVTVDHAPDDLLDARDLDRPRPNVLATVTEGEGPTVALNAHFDTVPVEDAAWTRDPFGAEIEDGRLYGRGATDSKGRIASYTLAARALEAADLLPEDATLVLAVTADEETGGHAGAGHVVDAALRPDYAIVEGSSEEIWDAGCGVLHFRVTVEGEAAHAGTREDGENAVLAANGIVASLADHAADLADRESAVEGVDGPTCTPSTIEGGRKTNVVPRTVRSPSTAESRRTRTPRRPSGSSGMSSRPRRAMRTSPSSGSYGRDPTGSGRTTRTSARSSGARSPSWTARCRSRGRRGSPTRGSSRRRGRTARTTDLATKSRTPTAPTRASPSTRFSTRARS
jgi:hypothetical protein